MTMTVGVVGVVFAARTLSAVLYSGLHQWNSLFYGSCAYPIKFIHLRVSVCLSDFDGYLQGWFTATLSHVHHRSADYADW